MNTPISSTSPLAPPRFNKRRRALMRIQDAAWVLDCAAARLRDGEDVEAEDDTLKDVQRVLKAARREIRRGFRQK